jgi:hypothetical protein
MGSFCFFWQRKIIASQKRMAFGINNNYYFTHMLNTNRSVISLLNRTACCYNASFVGRQRTMAPANEATEKEIISERAISHCIANICQSPSSQFESIFIE